MKLLATVGKELERVLRRMVERASNPKPERTPGGVYCYSVVADFIRDHNLQSSKKHKILIFGDPVSHYPVHGILVDSTNKVIADSFSHKGELYTTKGMGDTKYSYTITQGQEATGIELAYALTPYELFRRYDAVVQSTLLKFNKHPLLHKTFGRTLVVSSILVDDEDKFGLQVKHTVEMENLDKSEIHVDTLLLAIKEIKEVFGNSIHIMCKAGNKRVTLSFYSELVKQS